MKDLDFIAMTLEERRVYFTLILYLYCNNGKYRLDISVLSQLCNKNPKAFERIWQNVSKKFQTRSGAIKHKRVTKGLTRAKKFIQCQRKAGLASAKKRQQHLNHSSAEVATPLQLTKTIGNVIEKENKIIRIRIRYSNLIRFGVRFDHVLIRTFASARFTLTRHLCALSNREINPAVPAFTILQANLWPAVRQANSMSKSSTGS